MLHKNKIKKGKILLPMFVLAVLTFTACSGEGLQGRFTVQQGINAGLIQLAEIQGDQMVSGDINDIIDNVNHGASLRIVALNSVDESSISFDCARLAVGPYYGANIISCSSPTFLATRDEKAFGLQYTEPSSGSSTLIFELVESAANFSQTNIYDTYKIFGKL